jgi:putative acetyltransferase
VRIRPESGDSDRAEIWKVNKEAFGRALEADLVDAIRASDRFVPELSLVATVEDDVVGHVLLSYVEIGPGAHAVLQLGPLAVLPSYQRRGIGSALMNEAVRVTDARGEPLILLEGNPRFYERFGFRRSDESGIDAPTGVDQQYFMVRPLTAYAPELRGQAVYSAAFLNAG